MQKVADINNVMNHRKKHLFTPGRFKAIPDVFGRVCFNCETKLPVFVQILHMIALMFEVISLNTYAQGLTSGCLSTGDL